MLRSIARILMIVVACAVLFALAFTVKAGATSANTVAWLTSGSGPAMQMSTPDASPSVTSSYGPGAQDVDSANGSDINEPAESAQENDPQNEQELSGIVSSVDSANAAFTLTTTSGAVTVHVNSMTQYDDGLSGLGSLQAGMAITVKSTSQAAGESLADEVKGSSDTNATDSGN